MYRIRGMLVAQVALCHLFEMVLTQKRTAIRTVHAASSGGAN